MRIVHVSPYFNSPEEGNFGGVELYVYELSKALAENGHEVAIYTSGSRLTNNIVRGPKTLEKKNNLEIHRFLCCEPPRMPYIFPHLKNPIPSPSFFSELSKEYDVIHIHGHEYATSFVATLAAKKGKIPTVLSIHNIGAALEEFSAIHLIRKLLDNTAFASIVNSAKIVITPTKQISVLRKFNPMKIVQIPLGIDLKRFDNLNSRSEYVLFIGRLEETKRPEDFIRAIPLVLKKIDADFVVAGTGIQFEHLKNLARNLQIENHVKFIGWVPYRDVPRVVEKASVVVAPGGAGYSIMEAAAAQKPIVSGKLDWNISVIGRESALYVKPGDFKNLSESIISLLSDRHLSKLISKNARDYVEKHESWDTLLHQFIYAYEDALSASHPKFM